jgi:predicted Zn finger-like uncharacterized protein
MLTVCTHCKTKFRVSSAQLKAAQGQVRCGKCHEVFDAFWALEGNNSDPQPMQAEPATTPNLDSVSATPAAAPELDTIIRAGDEPLTDAPALRAGPRKPELPPIDDLFGDLGHLPDDEMAVRAEPTFSEVPDVATPAEARPEPAEEFSIPAAVHAEDLPQPPAKPARRPWAGAAAWSGILLLAVLLGLQLVNANSATLAQNPVLGPSLLALYAAMGRPLQRPSAVQAWDVSGLNVTSDPQAPGVLSITGTLQDQADFPQPWPYLRVELTDRFGQPLRGRDFKPGEYLPGAQADVMLTPGQAARFRIDIADPGPDAVGFTLSPCLDLPAGRICAASEHD